MNTGMQMVVLITGAARGIGFATAKRFLADGWHVALLDIDSETLGRNHQALAAPDTTLALHCDVRPSSVAARRSPFDYCRSICASSGLPDFNFTPCYRTVQADDGTGWRIVTGRQKPATAESA